MGLAAPAVPSWLRLLRAAQVVVTAAVIVTAIPLMLDAGWPTWTVIFPAGLLIAFLGTLWRSRGQFRGASRDHPIVARSRRGLVLSLTWLVILAVYLVSRIVAGSSWLLIGLVAIMLLFFVGAVAEAASVVPRNERGEEVPEGPAEDLRAP